MLVASFKSDNDCYNNNKIYVFKKVRELFYNLHSVMYIYGNNIIIYGVVWLLQSEL